MKVLVTSMKNENETIVANYQILPMETENIKHELIEIKELEDKNGYHKKLVWDSENKMFLFEYHELPESETERLNKEIIKLKQSIVDISVKQIKEKDFDDVPEIPEELGLSSSDIDSLDLLKELDR